jgi:hypothetical protein
MKKIAQLGFFKLTELFIVLVGGVGLGAYGIQSKQGYLIYLGIVVVLWTIGQTASAVKNKEK